MIAEQEGDASSNSISPTVSAILRTHTEFALVWYQEGERYEELRPVISICFLDGVLFPERPDSHS